MFQSQCTNSKINRFYERALKIAYGDGNSTFDQLIDKEKSFYIHRQNIQRFLIEIYKALNDISESILKELFVRREYTIYLPSKPKLVIPSVNLVLKRKN